MEKTAHQRFAEQAEAAGITASDLSRILGLKIQGVYKYLNGESVPKVELLEKLVVEYPQLNMEYIVRGEGPRLYAIEEVVEGTDEERAVYRRVTPDRKHEERIAELEKELKALRELAETQKGYIKALEKLLEGR